MSVSLPLLQQLEPIRGLSASRLAELVTLAHCVPVAQGEDPLKVDASVTSLRYWLSGELLLYLPDGCRKVIVGGSDIALWPIGYKTPWPLSSRAITDGQILALDFDLLDLLMTWDDMAAAAPDCPGGETGAWPPIEQIASAQALSSCALAHLPPANIHELMRRFERIAVQRGCVVIAEGATAEDYFLIESGWCTISKQVGGVQMVVAELKPGDAFGEEALLAESQRTATATMSTDGVLLRLAKPDFIELLQAPLLHSIAHEDAQTRVVAGQSRWLDVRYPAEFGEDGLAHAVNVPLNEIRTAFNVLDRSVEYIVYCQSGRRSSAAAFLLAQNGFKARWLIGGLGRMENA